MSTLIPYINIAEAVVGAVAATISLVDALVRHRIGRR
jgi:hypothetical protein